MTFAGPFNPTGQPGHFLLKGGVDVTFCRCAAEDLAGRYPVQLARTLRKAPRAIAQDIAETVGELSGIGRLEPTGAGYLNVFLDRATFARDRVAGDAPTAGGTSDRQTPSFRAVLEKVNGQVRSLEDTCGSERPRRPR